MKVGGQSILYKPFVEKNVFFIADLLDEAGKFMSFEQVKHVLGVNTNFIQYNGLLRTLNMLTNKLHIEPQNNNIPRPTCPRYIRILIIDN